MNAITLRTRVLLALLLAGLGCSSADPAGPPLAAASEAGKIAMGFGSATGRLARDAYRIEEARIDGDTLRARISHGGGCKRHTYGFIAYDGWLESFPVQVGALILHDANDDACDALLRADLRFDLTPLRTAFEQAYRSAHGTVIIRLADPQALGGAALVRLEYTF